MRKSVQQKMKNNKWTLLILLFFITLYVPVILLMYVPERRLILDSLVEDEAYHFLKVMGAQAGSADLYQYMNSYLYRFILQVIPSVFCIWQGAALIKASLKRKQFPDGQNSGMDRIVEHMGMLLTGLLLLVLYTCILESVLIGLFYPDEFSVTRLLLMNLNWFLQYVCLGCLITILCLAAGNLISLKKNFRIDRGSNADNTLPKYL